MTAKQAVLENIARKELNEIAPRRFAVVRPLKVLLTGLPKEGKSFDMPNHPTDESKGKRPLKLTSTIYIEKDDFRPDLADDPKFFGLAVGREAGLLGAGVNITVTAAHTNPSGEITHISASVDMTRERKPKGHLHWVSADTAVAAECRVYDILFTPEDPEGAAKEAAASGAAPEEEEEEDDDEGGGDGTAALPGWLKLLNPKSLVVEHALVEPALAKACGKPVSGADRPAFQFQRVGFFCVDDDSSAKKPVFNRVVSLKEDKERKAM